MSENILEVEHLKQYFQVRTGFAKKTPLIEHTQLLYETIPAVTWCNACKQTYPTMEYGKTCPYCGSGETWLLRGNEMNIKQIVAC